MNAADRPYPIVSKNSSAEAFEKPSDERSSELKAGSMEALGLSPRPLSVSNDHFEEETNDRKCSALMCLFISHVTEAEARWRREKNQVN